MFFVTLYCLSDEIMHSTPEYVSNLGEFKKNIHHRKAPKKERRNLLWIVVPYDNLQRFRRRTVKRQLE
jgi:hypothetical protein